MPRSARAELARARPVGWHHLRVIEDGRARLHRYWLRFAIAPGELGQHPSWAGLGLGCGVTVFTLDDAMDVLRRTVFGADPMPEIEHVIEDIDVQTLDPGRVRPNMGPPNERGVWFPRI